MLNEAYRANQDIYGDFKIKKKRFVSWCILKIQRINP